VEDCQPDDEVSCELHGVIGSRQDIHLAVTGQPFPGTASSLA
jgi:hypothetical protein